MPITFDQTEVEYSKIDFSVLTEVLKQAGNIRKVPKGTLFTAKPDIITVILEGGATIMDREEDGLAMGHTFKLQPVGLIERYHKNVILYYHANSQMSVVELTYEDFDKVMLTSFSNALFFSRIMSFLAASLIHIYYERNSDSGYSTIRHMLHRYLYKSEDNTIHGEGIAMFILKRTRLSRSYVFQILSGLKTGGYITVQNGKLISINKAIPPKF